MDIAKRQTRLIEDMTERLRAAAGDSLRAVILYGPAARGERYRDLAVHLLIVVADLEPATLAGLSAPVRWWLDRKQPMPRIFSPAIIAAAADVFPMELLDITDHHRYLYGDDVLAGIDVRIDHLRLQCERELRENMMRLCEAFIEAGGRKKHLWRLLGDSYINFVNIFRGCLRLTGDAPPVRDAEVIDAFCARIDIDAAPFHAVERVKHGEPVTLDAEALFADYYGALEKTVDAVDRFNQDTEKES
jgi:hypothetical protein